MKDKILEQLREATLGEYEILLELGSGGMATVFLAHDLQLDRKVAIKLMHPALVAGNDMVERFILEARTAAGLSHANIVPIYAVKVQEDLLYFVMKFVEGRPLDSIIKAEAPLAADTVRHVVTQVADALGYAHRRGVIHRDVKPANIIISTDGHPILADFGIAKVADKPGLTLTGATIGTPAYMSPEQCSAEPVTGASDQYSLGVTAFEMLTGTPPFDAPSFMTIMLKQMNEPAPPIHDRAAACPPDLAVIVDRMLAKEPAGRFGAMEEIVEALQTSPNTSLHTVRTQLVGFAMADPRRERLKRVSTPRSPIPTAARRSQIATASAPGPLGSRRMIAGGLLVAALAAGALLLTLRGKTAIRALDSTPPVATAPAATVAPPASSSSSTATLPDPPVTTLLPPRPSPVAPRTPAAALPERAPQQVVAAVRIIGPGSLSAGGGGVLQVEARDAAGAILVGREVTWTSDEPSVLTVSAGGRLDAKREGRAIITASVDGVSQQHGVSVTGELAALVSIDPATLAMTAGESTSLRVTIVGSSGHMLGHDAHWSSSAPSVATVTRSGGVTAIGPGLAVISATSGGRIGTTTVSVTVPKAPDEVEHRQQIVQMINAYAKALESRDVSRVRQLYPAMPTAREEKVQDALERMDKLEVQLKVGQIEVAEDAAIAHVTGTWLFTSQGQRTTLPANDRYRLERRGTGWVITDIQ